MAAAEQSAPVTFSTLNFVIFAVIFFAGWSVVRAHAPKTLAWTYLTIASLVFYGLWEWKNIFVLVGITTANFAGGRALKAAKRYRGWILALAIAAALGPLIALKYLGFVFSVINSIGDSIGVRWSLDGSVVPEWPLPLGISFITLSAISYVVDVYTGETSPTPNIVQHFSFLALFPVMIAGPVMRAGQILPQLAELPSTTADQRWAALKLITYGLVKKCVVADHIDALTSQMYEQMFVPPPSSTVWWFTAVLFAIQIYADFSGYTDIARGLGRWIGLDLPENFDRPYFAAGFSDFWMRWHISFSSWLRDYVYFPLARAWNSSRLGGIAAVMTTFFVSGLWHGAAWTFVAYGLLNGLLISIESVTHWNRRLASLPGGRVLVSLVVFLVVCLLLVVFRAHDLEHAWSILRIMFSFQSSHPSWIGRDRGSWNEPLWLVLPAVFVLVELSHLLPRGRFGGALRDRFDLGWLGIALLLLASVYLRGSAPGFIYAGF